MSCCKDFFTYLFSFLENDIANKSVISVYGFLLLEESHSLNSLTNDPDHSGPDTAAEWGVS